VAYGDAGFIFSSLGNWEEAVEEAREALRLEPNSVRNYLNLGGADANLNRLDEAEAMFKEAEERKLKGEFLLQFRYLSALVDHCSYAASRSTATWLVARYLAGHPPTSFAR